MKIIKQIRPYFKEHGDRIWPLVAIFAVVGTLMLYKLGSLAGGITARELAVINTSIGWQGIAADPFYLPLKFLRSTFFVIFDHHGQTVVRLANVLFGVLAVYCFARILQFWYGGRTAFMGSILFLTSAWVLHVSRYASYDVLYLAALPVLFYVQMALRQGEIKAWVYVAPVVWGLALYIPGLVWLIATQIWLLRKEIVQNWKNLHKLWQRIVVITLGVMWLPLLLSHAFSSKATILTWLGLPTSMPPLIELGKQFLSVPVHLFVHGPYNPEIWLGKAPILDVFTLICAILGIYFYATHLKANRSRSLFSLFIVSWLLIAAGGPVPLSLMVPLLYLFAACGIGYLMQDWLKTFPRNPFARTLGIFFIALAVSASVAYNLRAYFVAWPHNKDTQAIFVEKP